MDLVREILIAISDGDIDSLIHDRQSLHYHFEMLINKGFIEGIFVTRTGGGTFACQAVLPTLTWDGHEFLETIRPPKIWTRIKAVLKEKGLELTIDAIFKAANLVIEQTLK